MNTKADTMRLIQLLRLRRINNNEKSYNKNIAEELNITQATLSNLATGVHGPDADTWRKIVQALKNRCTKEEFITIIYEIYD